MKLARKKTKYTLEIDAHLKAVRELKKFVQENERIFTRYGALMEEVDVTKNALSTAAKKAKSSFDSKTISVEYVMPKHRWLDPKKVRELVPSKVLDALDVIKTAEEVDVDVLKTLIKAKKVPESVLTEALVEEDTGSPRVTVKIKE